MTAIFNQHQNMSTIMSTITSSLRLSRDAFATASIAAALLLIGAERLPAVTGPNAATNTISYTQKLMRGNRMPGGLIWLGDKAPSDAESQALWEAFISENGGNFAELPESLESFLKDNPDSPWRFSVNLCLGQRYRQTGYFSLALDKWKSVWNATKGMTDRNGRAIADAALLKWLTLLADLGQAETMKELLDETKGRQLPASDQHEYSRLNLRYFHMMHHPENSYLCGTYALDAVMRALYGTNTTWNWAKQKSPETGFSMAMLQAISESNHLGLAAVQRTAGTELVVPSVVHLKENHYVAIVGRKDEMYRVADSTFRSERWMTSAAINHEASGAFLVPANQVPSGWRSLTSTEASQIFGKGYTGPGVPPYPPCPPDTCCPSGGGGTGGGGGGGGNGPGNGPGCTVCTGGMPVWEVTEPDINLWLTDEPLAYQTATAGRFSLRIYYNELFPPGEPGQYSYPGLLYLGPGWTCSWMRYVCYGGYFGGDGITLYTAGGIEPFPNLDTPDFYSNDRMHAVVDASGNTNAFEVIHPDGAIDVYSNSFPGWQGGYDYPLTQQIDKHGRATTFLYDTANPEQLDYVVDADGKTNTMTYNQWDSFDTIYDPYGHTNQFYYDSFGVLTNIIDVAGISTTFSYSSYLDLTNMLTPYGSTGFQFGSVGSSICGDLNYHYGIVTEANGSTNLFLFAAGMCFAGVPEVYTDTNNVPTYRPADNPGGSNTLDNPDWSDPTANDGMNVSDSFYWNPQQFANLTPEFLQALASQGPIGIDSTPFDLLRTNDYFDGRMRHYNMPGPTGGGRTLSMEQQPSPDGVAPGTMTWYDYPNKPAYNVQGSSAYPSMIIKVLPDGTEAYTIYQTDQWGNRTNVISTYSVGNSVLTRTNTYVYSTNGIDLLQSIGPDPVTINSYGYDLQGLHLVLFMTNAVGNVTGYMYNTDAQITRITQPTGLVTTNLYDTNGCLTNTYDYAMSGGSAIYYRTNSYTYSNGMVLTHTDELGRTETNSWDNLMRLTSVSDARGAISNIYNILDLAEVVDRLGFTNTYGYNSIRQKVAWTNALGYYTQYSYCPCGGLDTIVDAAGNTTTFNYDYAGRLTNKIYPDGYSVTNMFDSVGRITNITDGRGVSTTNWYNNQGLVVAVSNAYGLVQSLAYDIDDRVTNQVDPNGVVITNAYDNLGRLLIRGYPDGGTNCFGYSAAGLVAYTNQLGFTTYYGYDAARRKVAETNANQQVTQYAYDARSDLISLTDQNTNTTQWGYDIYGRVTNKVDAMSTTILKYAYDADNRLTNRWSAQKGNTAYGYDKVGNLTSVTYPHSAALAFSYDAMNWLTNMSDGVGTTEFTYSQTGQLQSETGPWPNDAIKYSYIDRLRTGLDLQRPNGPDWMQIYDYDAANRMTNITSQAGTFGYAYNPGLNGADASGLVAEITLPNGAFITNTYDNNGRMTGTYFYNSGLTNLDSSVYTYNRGNERTSVTRTGENTAHYMYDLIGQVIADLAYETNNGPPRLNEQLTYGFDPAGNLNYRTNNALIQNFAVNSDNELTTATNGGTLTVVGTTTSLATNVTVNGNAASRYGDATFAARGLSLTTTYTAVASDSYGRWATNTVTVNLATNVTFQYDANGNLTSDGLCSFAYDDENQLIQVWVTNQWLSQFSYDGKMRRRIRQEFTWTGGAWLQTNAVYYVYDGNLVIQERDLNNLPTTTYTRGKDLSGSLEGAGGIGGLLARTAQSYVDAPLAGHAFYHADANGNITMLINSSQAIVAKYLYDAFGNVLSKSGLLADANLYRFSSKEAHLNSGLVYYLYRYYDPNLQRWPNRDPLGCLGFFPLNSRASTKKEPPYAFVWNDPIAFMDPYGLFGAAVCMCVLTVPVDVTVIPNDPACCGNPGWIAFCLYHCYPIITIGACNCPSSDGSTTHGCGPPPDKAPCFPIYFSWGICFGGPDSEL
jgi:RHS repeat-associated protein